MVLQGRSEAGSQSVAVITPLTRRCRARVRHPNGPARPRTATQDLLALNIDLASVMLAGRWKSNRMPMRYGERVLAAKGGMARAAAE
jgi:hypothetical protein